MKLWGIDLGGTKIECAVLDEKNNWHPVIRKRIATEAHKGYHHILSQIKKLIDEVVKETGLQPTQIGFATPGALEPDTELMKNCNTVCMNGQPMKFDLENLLQAEVKIANDANSFALAEALMGAGKNFPGAEVVFGVIMGTGVGGGLVVHGKLINGRHSLGGEWGHNVIDQHGDPCYCGKIGCVEQVISGTALEKYYATLSKTNLKLEEIFARHKEGNDRYATATIGRLLEYYGKAISTLINVIDPDLIVIGGGVGNIDLLYTEGYEHIRKHVFNNGKLTTPICKPLLGDSAGVFGAALLWNKPNEHLYAKTV